MSLKETAEKLGVSVPTLRNYIRERIIEPIRIGRSLRFKSEDVDYWYENGFPKPVFKKRENFYFISSSKEIKINSIKNEDEEEDAMAPRKPGERCKIFPKGSVFFLETKSGRRWYSFVQINGKPSTKALPEDVKTFTQAKRAHMLRVRELLTGEMKEERRKGEIKFFEFANLYLDYVRINTPTNFRNAQSRLKEFKQFFGDIPLTAITPEEIEKFKMQKVKKVRKLTVNHYLNQLRHMLNIAVDRGYLKTNPMAKVKNFRIQESEIRTQRVLSEEEEEKLLNSCSGFLKKLIIVALNTGMRKSEILNLKWEEVDLNERLIILTNTKNRRIREIPINDDVFEVFREELKHRRSSPYVFVSRANKPIDSMVLQRAFKRVARRVGISELRFHDLRHTFATRLLQKGVDIITVMLLLGHSDVTMTQRYSHSALSQKREAVEKLSSKKLKKNLKENGNFIPMVVGNGLFSIN